MCIRDRLTAALKINTDLERIGELSVHVAERALLVMHHPLVRPLVDIPRMATLVQSMLLRCQMCIRDSHQAGDR